MPRRHHRRHANSLRTAHPAPSPPPGARMRTGPRSTTLLSGGGSRTALPSATIKRLEELERRAGSTNGESVGEKETSCTRRKGADGTSGLFRRYLFTQSRNESGLYNGGERAEILLFRLWEQTGRALLGVFYMDDLELSKVE
ncbi:hypothetical protein B0T14DRAFT_3647 [Immersiella caudata]|uniref:Uncharacterized protein n=1 Tax=Immersiella caudata TaxID=314043 RepID=A0AA40CBI2_9PEZI|nr:hypothetical protein B0T14DRAFT_3647 [Immersiella caudata]